MSFSLEVKKELCAVRELTLTQMTAMLYGLFFAGKTVNRRETVRTENADLFAAVQTLALNVFPNEHYDIKRMVNSTGSQYSFAVKSKKFSEKFGDLSEINPNVVSGNDIDSGAFLRGVFAACGSVTDPAKGYHLEMALPEQQRTEPLRCFAEEHGIMLKTTSRAGIHVLYTKTSEVIEDFLTYIGAGAQALEIMQIKIEKDLRNRANRSVNCEVANLDKTVAASEKSRRDIEFIIEKIGLDALPDQLRDTARLRLENPESSLAELSAMIPISRSGFNHRLKKLSQLADSLRKENGSTR